MRLLLLPLLLLLVLAAPASAATVDDVAVAEADGGEVAVHGAVTAWRDGSDVVVRKADGSTRQVAVRGFAEGLTIGQDAARKLVVVVPDCPSSGSCRLRRIDVASGRRAFVAGVRGRLRFPVLRRGILAWVDGSTVRSRRLAGGRVRREDAGRPAMELTGLDHDGRRFAITGSMDDTELDRSETQVRLGRLGRRGTRDRGGLGSSQEHQAILRPRLTSTAVEVLSDDLGTFQAAGVYERIYRYPLNGGRRQRVSFGVPFTAIATGGGRTALLQASSTYGCGPFTGDEDDFEDRSTLDVPCRVVLAGAAPFSADTRRTVPELTMSRAATSASGRVVRRLVSGRTGRTTSAQGVANVPVRVARPQGSRGFAQTGADATTGADGRFEVALPATLRTAETLGAYLVTRPRAFAGRMAERPGE